MMRHPAPRLCLIVYVTESGMPLEAAVCPELTVVAVLGNLTQALFWSAGE